MVVSSLLSSPPLLSSSSPTPLFFLLPPATPQNTLNRRRRCRRLCYPRRRPVCCSLSTNGEEEKGQPQYTTNIWSRLYGSMSRGSQRLASDFREQIRREVGIDVNEEWGSFVDELGGVLGKGKEGMRTLVFGLLPRFVEWNKMENWKDFNRWEAKRIGAFFMYMLVLLFTCHKTYRAITVARVNSEKRVLTEAFMESLIPEPSPSNIRKFKKGMWRKNMPKGLKIKKYIQGPDGVLLHDDTYVGENAWEDDAEKSDGNPSEVHDSDSNINSEQKETLENKLGIIEDDLQSAGGWRERLVKWETILKNDRLAENLDSFRAKFAADFDMQEVEKSLRQEVAAKAEQAQGGRALWISKRWWLYRPKLPYMYFLDKLDSSQVAAVVFTEDLKRIYVTMKEGFPLEYSVDIPLDPHLFEIITSSGVDVDLLQRKQIFYLLRVVIALAPGLLILYFIREGMMLLHATSQRFLYKEYHQLFDRAYSENFIMSTTGLGGKESMQEEVILGGDCWDLLDELLMYLDNPMQYFERQVEFARGVLIYGPPGTGKTLFARTLANKIGLPFVHASGAEFSGSSRSGVARINKLFHTARRNAPSFVFIDEIDAIAGPYARKDKQRRATFNALISQLDGEKEKTGVDRTSLRQAVIFLCATNRADELDPEFLKPGRIDRRLHIGLPSAKQRVKIFDVHSAGRKLSDDVDFRKLVFRTVLYTGADIRNLVNEAAINSVRKGRSMITQQDVIDVLDKEMLEGMGVLLTEEEQQKSEETVPFEKKKLLAVHEAGHILLAHLLPRFDWHGFSQLLPGGKETAVSVFYPRDEMIGRASTTFGYLKMQMVVAHGGRCAERVVYGDITDRGRDDLEKISKLGREMVISPRNPRLGLTQLVSRLRRRDRRDDPENQIIKYTWDDPHVVPASMSVEVSELFTRELTRYIQETEEIAMDGLRRNRHILDVIVTELLKKSRITGLEVEERMRSLNPLMFEDMAGPHQYEIDQESPSPPLKDQTSYKPLEVYPAPLHRC